MSNPLIVALDVDSAAAARALVQTLGDSIGFYKVGLELYAAAGPEFVRELLGDGKQVFLDLKFHDIGETVRRAVALAARTGVHFLTVHAVPQVMRAAMEGKGTGTLRILGVTVLTSLDDQDLRADGSALEVSRLVELRVRNAVACGLDGLVCSPLEVARVRAIAGPEMVLVTPGVRSAGAAAGDQKRVATPVEALRQGADWLVVGREATRAADPRAVIVRILGDLRAAGFPKSGNRLNPTRG